MMRTTGGFSRPYTPVQPVGAVFGTAFLLVGALGFVPGVTAGELGTWPGAGTAVLAGLLPVSVLQNAVNLAIGVAGLLAARSAAATRAVLVAGGLVALATAAWSLGPTGAGLVVVAVAMVACAVLLRGRPVVGGRRGAAAH